LSSSLLGLGGRDSVEQWVSRGFFQNLPERSRSPDLLGLSRSRRGGGGGRSLERERLSRVRDPERFLVGEMKSIKIDKSRLIKYEF